jgi:hypothetical protein
LKGVKGRQAVPTPSCRPFLYDFDRYRILPTKSPRRKQPKKLPELADYVNINIMNIGGVTTSEVPWTAHRHIPAQRLAVGFMAAWFALTGCTSPSDNTEPTPTPETLVSVLDRSTEIRRVVQDDIGTIAVSHPEVKASKYTEGFWCDEEDPKDSFSYDIAFYDLNPRSLHHLKFAILRQVPIDASTDCPIEYPMDPVPGEISEMIVRRVTEPRQGPSMWARLSLDEEGDGWRAHVECREPDGEINVYNLHTNDPSSRGVNDADFVRLTGLVSEVGQKIAAGERVPAVGC